MIITTKGQRQKAQSVQDKERAGGKKKIQTQNNHDDVPELKQSILHSTKN